MLTNNDLKLMGIYELRNYARSQGVYAPTTKSKDELIKEIEKIKTGELEPVFTNRGRCVMPHRQSFFDMIALLKEFKELLKTDYEKSTESLYNYYCNNMSSKSEVTTTLNLYNYSDFIIYFNELINNSFDAKVTEIKNGFYRLNFKDTTIYITIDEELP